MLMRMLAAGGLPVVADEIRRPDIDNPYGYFEDTRVLTLPTTAHWIDEARGRAVKIVSPLLRHLPSGHAYRVVFALRDLHETLVSQHQMLARRGTPPTPQDDARVLALYERHLAQIRAWLAKQPHIDVLEVPFAEVIAHPAAEAARIAAFLGGGFDVESMAQVVDVRLYRNRR